MAQFVSNSARDLLGCVSALLGALAPFYDNPTFRMLGSRSSMTVRTNRAMLELLAGDPEFFEPNSLPVPDVLVSQLAHGFKVVDGCIVPSSFESKQIWSDRRRRKDNQDDETGFECLLSKTCLEDFFPAEVPLFELCRVGLAYGTYLRTAISESRVFGQFRFIVDAQHSTPHGSPAASACSVYFHKLRPNQHWLYDQLEAYKENALLVMDWDNPASQPHIRRLSQGAIHRSRQRRSDA